MGQQFRLLIGMAWTCAGAACAREDAQQQTPALEPPKTELQADLQRTVAAAIFEEEDSKRYDEIQRLLDGVVASPFVVAQDHVNLACLEMARLKPNEKPEEETRADGWLKQAVEIDPELASVHYCLGMRARQKLDFDAALAHYQRALQLAPPDVPTRLCCALMLEEVDRALDAEVEYQKLFDLGFDGAGGFFKTAMYRLAFVTSRSKDPDKAQRGRELMTQYRQLDHIPMHRDQQLERGNLGKVRARAMPTMPPAAARVAILAAGVPWNYERVLAGWLAQAGAIHDVEAADVDGDTQLDLLAATQSGVYWGKQTGMFQFTAERIDAEEARNVLAISLETAHEDNHRARPLAVLTYGNGRKMRLFVLLIDRFEDQSAQLPDDLIPTDVARVDFDHEGDLDLVCATAKGLRLFCNNGRSEISGQPTGPFSFTEVSAEARLPSGAFEWVDIEDFDDDADIDLIAGGSQTDTVLLSSLRLGRFRPIASNLPGRMEPAPLLADVNHDGKPDLLRLGKSPGVFLNDGKGRFRDSGTAHDWGMFCESGECVLIEVDGDGALDLVGLDTTQWLCLRIGSLVEPHGVTLSPGPIGIAGDAPLFEDLDDDGDLDFVARGKSGLDVLCNRDAAPRYTLRLNGRKDNLQAIGTTIEVRAGTHYQRRMVRGSTEAFGMGGTQPDLVRIRWPNGIVQVPPRLKNCFYALDQRDGLPGSCPFLYTWNGKKYEFVTDVLGTTPLGLPINPGVFVPADHDELVRIEGRQLNACDGEFRLQVTEELREVTYLDRAQLWVVEHEADVEVHPEERFTFPPFPERHVHALRELHPVTGIKDGTGRAWNDALAAIDSIHAIPFEILGPQFQGLATPHTLEFRLPDAAATARRIRVLLTGWFYWADASVNIASAQHPSIEFVPPMLEVPDTVGNFQNVGVLGFPAGKTKTMVVDVTDLVNRKDLRLRLFSTLRLYWDCIRVALDAQDCPITLTKLEATHADLYFRGLSKPVAESRDDQPERFEFGAIEDQPRWNQHPGMLTRYGDVQPLLESADDRFVIFSSGDAIELRFPAGDLPPLRAGMQRTYLLDLDGWAKDGDPNTTHAEQVEPLPFHAMSGYPYPDDEHYPDDELHRAYRAEWNTRPGRKLITPMIPEHATDAKATAVPMDPRHARTDTRSGNQ